MKATILLQKTQQFCINNNLDESTMNKVAQGKRNAHKGYKRIESSDNKCIKEDSIQE